MNRLILLTLWALFSFQSFINANENLQEGVPGKIISPGANPYTKSWKEMQRKEEERRAKEGANKDKIHRAHEAPRSDQPNKFLHRKKSDKLTSLVTELLPQTAFLTTVPIIGINFKGVSYQDELDTLPEAFFPPDTMGAVGPNHFMEVINGAVAIYSKTGVQISIVSLNTFFTFTSGMINYPRGNAVNPRVLFDKQSGRWFACALEINPPGGMDSPGQNNNILLAISRTDDPTGNWDLYAIPAGELNFFANYDTLGVDTNGVYFGVNMFPTIEGNVFHAKILATRIATLLASSPTLGSVYQSSYSKDQMFGCIQPCHNQDIISPRDPAWFVTSNTFDFENILYLNFTWPAVGAPTFPANFTTITTPRYNEVFPAPAKDGSDINTNDDRPLMAIIRNQRLWTTRNIGVNQFGTDSSPADRVAAEFISLNVSTSTATLDQEGRVFDNASENPLFYYYPSLSVNKFCDVVMGFSGSNANTYVSAYVCGRLGIDPPGFMGPVILLKNGVAPYNLDADPNEDVKRWGPYSYTSLDPVDETTFWTIQEYAEEHLDEEDGGNWGTYIAQLNMPLYINGEVMGSTTVCGGNNSGMLTLTGVVGTVIRWEFSVDGGVTWIPIANTSTTQTFTNLVQTTQFRAVIGVPCTTFSLPATVTVDFAPTVFGSPQSQTICSGTSTDIVLTSDVAGTTFIWSVVQNGVQGAASGSGDIIQQILETTSKRKGTAVYTITPMSPNGCLGVSIMVTVTVKNCHSSSSSYPRAPRHFRGKVIENKFATQTDVIHELFWDPSKDATVVKYRLYQGDKLIRTLAAKDHFKVVLHNRRENKRYHYKLVAVDIDGVESHAVDLSLP